MRYKDAARIRETGFKDAITKRVAAGASVRSAFKQTISEKSQANFVGLKQKFDPLNILKVATFGGNFAPTLYGRIAGRSKSDVDFFTKTAKKKRVRNNRALPKAMVSPEVNKGVTVLNDMLAFMKKTREEQTKEEEVHSLFEEEQIKEEDKRHTEVINVFLEATKNNRKGTKALTQPRDSKGRFAKKPKEEAPAVKEVPKGPLRDSKGRFTAAPAPTAAGAPSVVAPATATVASTVSRETAKKLAVASVATVAATAGTPALAGKRNIAANIAAHESKFAGYNDYNKAYYKDKKTGKDVFIKRDVNIDFSKMTIAEYLRRSALPVDDPQKLHAVGKYQIIRTTMLQLVDKMKLDPEKVLLTPETQDFLFAEGLVGVKRKVVSDYINGKMHDRDQAVLALAMEFASVGVPRDMVFVTPAGKRKVLKKGQSFYPNQIAKNNPDDVAAALDADRKLAGNKIPVQMAKPTMVETPVSPPVLEAKKEEGEKLLDASINNKALTDELLDNITNPGPALITTEANTYVENTIQVSQATQDINPMLEVF